MKCTSFFIAVKILHSATKEKKMWITVPQKFHGMSNLDSPLHTGDLFSSARKLTKFEIILQLDLTFKVNPPNLCSLLLWTLKLAWLDNLWVTITLILIFHLHHWWCTLMLTGTLICLAQASLAGRKIT